MIGSMRRGKGGVGVWIMLGLLFVGLIGFGIGGTGALSTTSIGTVGSTPIQITTYVSTLSQTRAQLQQQLGRTPTGQELQQQGILASVLDDAVRSTALDDLNASFGLSVGDEAVRDLILGNPNFVSSDGAFNETAYDFFLNNNGLTASQYEELLRRGSTRLLLEQVLQTSIEAPEAAAGSIVSYALEARDVAWITLSETDLPEPVAEVSDATVQSYYDDNAPEFESLETKEITYVWLTPSQVSDIEVSQEDLRAQYDEVLESRYSLPDRRGVERLVFSDPADAEAALVRVTSGEASFADIVTERGLTINDIDLGIIERDGIASEAADTVFGSAETGLFGPVEEPLGAALYNVTAVLEAQIISFEEAEPELRAELEADLRSNVVNDLVPQVDDLLAAGATLEEVEAETALVLETLSYTAETGSGIAAYQEFRDLADSSLEGDFPELFTLSDGGIFAIRVDDVIPAGTLPFEDVAEDARQLAQAAAVDAALRSFAEGLQTRVGGGEDLSSLGFPSSAISDLRRGVPTSDFDFLDINAIFDAEDGGFTILTETDGIALVQIEAIKAPDLEEEETAGVLSRVNVEMSRQMGADLLLGFADAVAEEAGTSLDFNVIDQVNTQILGLTFSN